MFMFNRAVQLLVDPIDGRIVDANETAAVFYGWPLDTLRTMRIQQINTATPGEIVHGTGWAAQEAQGHGLSRHRLASGEVCDVEVHSEALYIDDRELLYSIVHDVTERKNTERRLAGQAQILGKIAEGAPLSKLLEDITLFIESMGKFKACTVLLADNEQGLLRHGAAPSLPESYNRLVDGLPIREGMGSCGTAAARGRPVIVNDVQSDPLWLAFREIAQIFGIGACWSFPFMSGKGELLGTFALYYDHPETPKAAEIDLVSCATALASMAVERHRDAQRLRDSETKYRAIFQQAAIGAAQVGLDGRWLDVNWKLCDILGYDREELLSLNFQTLTHPDDLATDLEYMGRFLSGDLATCTLEKRYRRKDGSYIWVNLTASLLCGAAQEPLFFICAIEDISNHKHHVSQIQSGLERLRHQQACILSLIDNEDFFCAEPTAALQLLTTSAATALAVQRVSFWELREDGRAIVGMDEYDAQSGRHRSGSELLACDYPAYFRALLVSKAIVADDACGHPATECFSESYLRPLGIGAMMDVSVRLQGQVIGVLCIEHVGTQRDWSEDERFFALSLANLISLVFEHGERRLTEKSLRRRDALLEAIAYSAERMLSSSDWTVDLPGILERLGQAVESCRVHVFRIQEDRVFHYMEWCPESMPARFDDSPLAQEFSLQEAGFARWSRALAAARPSVEELPVSERDGLVKREVRSLAVAPIFVRKVCWGWMGLDDGNSHRQWSAVELDAIKAVANNLGTAIERQQAEASLRLAATAFETSEGIFITDREANILRVNQAFVGITGFSAEEAVGQNPRILRSDKQDKAFYRQMWSSLLHERRWEGELWNRRKNGEVYPQWMSIKGVSDEAGEITHFVANFLDISERKRAESEIAQLAFFDPLTKLPNRRLLMDRLQHFFSRTQRDRCFGALMFVDLDHFKHLNDALGHAMGDLLLQQVADRLRGLLRENDSISRLGGDEFVVLLELVSSSTQDSLGIAQRVAEKILEEMNLPFMLGEHIHHISTSIGVTIFPGQAATVEDVIKQADTAMYRAKAEGRNTYRFFEPAMQAAAENRLETEKALRAAIAREEFELHLQPQVNRQGRLIASEALVRWNRPGRGQHSPDTFIPIAEETGLILPLGQSVLFAACGILRQQTDRGYDSRLAVNISPRQFRQSNFVALVRDALDRTGAVPSRLTLELTESAVIEDTADAVAKMSELGALGIRFSIDDFGTGYSSLAYLRQLPVSEIKIDRSFIRDVIQDPNDAAIVDAILAMAERLGLDVVAEGVETTEQAVWLEARGCQVFQGYLFGRPVSWAEYPELIHRLEHNIFCSTMKKRQITE